MCRGAVEEADHACGECFGLSDGADLFTGFGFDPDLIGAQAGNIGDSLGHRRQVRRQFGLLEKDDGIEIDDAPACRADLAESFDEELGAVASFIFGCRVWEEATDIAQIGGTKEGVDDRVQEDIGVAVADRRVFRRNINTPDA